MATTPVSLLSQERVIQAATAVYEAYLLLDYLNRTVTPWVIKDKKESLATHVNSLIAKSPLEKDWQFSVSLGGESRTVLVEKIIESENSYSLTLAPATPPPTRKHFRWLNLWKNDASLPSCFTLWETHNVT